MTAPRHHNTDRIHPPTTAADPAELAAQILGQLQGDKRFILGLTGPPGTGKSTFVASISQALLPHPVVVVPMDGFHLANTVISGTPLQHRKGAIETFDAYGYSNLTHRLRRRDEDIVYAPNYFREFEEPIAAAVVVPRETQIIITEGNYLLTPTTPWTTARSVIDQIWYLHADDRVRRHRLINRHIEFGKTESEATAWVQNSDEVNALLISKTRQNADLIVNYY